MHNSILGRMTSVREEILKWPFCLTEHLNSFGKCTSRLELSVRVRNGEGELLLGVI